MKKIIFSLVLICLMALTATAAAPQLPYILYGHVDWNDQLLSGARLEITHDGVTTMLTTNGNGNWIHQISDYTKYNPKIGYAGDTVTIKVTDGCGTGDICSKSIQVGSVGNEDYGVMDFTLTGALSCPSISCPSCGSCGGGGSGYVNLVTEEKCEAEFPCDSGVCPTVKDCPAPTECPAPTCPAPTQEECKETVCDTCETCPEKEGSIFNYLLGIIGSLIIGGASTYYLKRKDAKLPNGTFVKYGGVAPRHLHRGIRGYHNPNSSHKEAHERHPKGELDPKYEKDAEGVYRYVA